MSAFGGIADIVRTTVIPVRNPTRGKRRDTVSQLLEKVVRVLRPDVDEAGLRQVIETFYVLRARGEFLRGQPHYKDR
jgi:hypothetical protein